MLLVIDCKKKLLTKNVCPHTNDSKSSKNELVYMPEEKEALTINDGKTLDEILHTEQELDYGDLGYYALGSKGKAVVDASIVISQTGFSCAYLIFISENIATMTESFTKYKVLIMLLPPLSLLVNFRHLKRLAIFSLFADFANVFAYCVVFWFDFKHFDNIGSKRKVINFSGLPFFLGIAIYCYEGAGMILALEASCAKSARSKFRSIFKLTLFLVTMLYILFGVCGYLSFGPDTDNIITLNLPPGIFPLLVKSCLCFSLFFTYPVMMFPVVAILEKKLFSDEGKSHYYYGTFLRGLMVIITGIVVLGIPDFSMLMALVGSSCCTLLAFILPALFHLQIFKGELSICAKLLDFILILLGVVGTVIGMRDVISRMMSPSETEE
ncbi:amino acid transporter AVT3B isoform X2 [Nematostella vectensis]|nr:amino acid transporter AVT3B isoform X2 [Nematostella vectensis]